MADSNRFVGRIERHLASLFPSGSSILVGLSGGVDSVVLLHLLCRMATQNSWRVSALHVHHGISQNADQWADFCVALGEQYKIPMQIEKVDITPLLGHGIEAAARKLRHAAFSRQDCGYVALAHHSDDQAETLLLQLLRGAGVRGAAGMPELKSSILPEYPTKKSVMLVRPLLHTSRREITEYATDQKLQWIEDESNADDSYPRNFLRHRVLPLLELKFPAYRATLLRSANHFAEASRLLDELAEQDEGQATQGNILQLDALKKLSPTRAKNLLRYFLHKHGVTMPQSTQLEEMLRQLCEARQDASVRIYLGENVIYRYRDQVYLEPLQGKFQRDFVLAWRGENALDWHPSAGRLHFTLSHGVGISLSKLKQEPVTVRLRRGNENLRPHRNSASRTLKNLLQEHHIPPWQRERMPLLFCGETLVSVVGVAVDSEYQALKNEDGVLVYCE